MSAYFFIFIYFSLPLFLYVTINILPLLCRNFTLTYDQILRQATTLLEVLYSAWYRHDLASGM